MGKVKQWSVEKKDQVEKMLISMWASLGMDIPSNYEDMSIAANDTQGMLRCVKLVIT